MGLLSMCSNKESNEDAENTASQSGVSAREGDGYSTPLFMLDPDYDNFEEGGESSAGDADHEIDDLKHILQNKGLIAATGSTIPPRKPSDKKVKPKTKKAKKRPIVIKVAKDKKRKFTNTKRTNAPIRRVEPS